MMKIKVQDIKSMKGQYGLTNYIICDDVAGVIWEDNKVIGFYQVEFKNKDTLFLDGLEIIEEFRGKGYGSRFLKLLFEKNPEIQYIKGYSLEESRNFYIKNNAIIISSCSMCQDVNCGRNALSNKNNGLEDVCEDYYDGLFIISRERMFENGLYN